MSRDPNANTYTPGRDARATAADPFTLLGLPRTFDVDLRALQAAYLHRSATLHPDRLQDPLLQVDAQRQAAALNKNAVPGWGLWIQAAWASVLCLSGRYGDLLDYIVFVVLIFYILTIGGIFVLRRKRPDAERPYRAFGYPVLPALYMVLAATICVMLLIYKPTYTWPGLIIVLLGVPIYYFILRRSPVPATEAG